MAGIYWDLGEAGAPAQLKAGWRLSGEGHAFSDPPRPALRL